MPSLNNFVVRAAALALRQHPILNATIAGTSGANTLNFSTATLNNIAGIYGLDGNDVITGSA